MVSQQILRAVARRVAALAAGVAVATAAALPIQAQGAPPIIDLRDDAPADSEQRAALAGRRYEPVRQRATAALERAGAAYGTLDCQRAGDAAGEAVLALASLQANGDDVADELRRAYAYRLLCADAAGDADAAFSAAGRLRALGGERPAGVSDALWQRYPALDATAATQLATVRVATVPDGGTVWVDHRPVGTAPLVVHLPEGQHVFAVAAAGGTAARAARFEGWGPHEVAIEVAPPTAGPLDEVRRSVKRLRARRRAPTGAEVAEVLGLLEATRGVIVEPGGAATGWVLDAGAAEARAVLRADDGQTAAERLAAWDEPAAPAPTAANVTESTPDAPERDPVEPWWVYAAIGGAVAAGVLAIVLSDVSSSRQRIELSIDPP